MKFTTENGEGCCSVCDDPSDIYIEDTGAWICIRCLTEIIRDGRKFLKIEKQNKRFIKRMEGNS